MSLEGAMQYVRSRAVAFMLATTFSVSLMADMPALANGKTGPTEVTKYLNPFSKNNKKNFVNPQQDRMIKKKAFKSGKNSIESDAATNREIGFFAVLPTEKMADAAFTQELLANPKVNGLSVLVPWAALQPTEDNFDWSSVDNLLALCEKSGKTLILRVSTSGVDLPDASDAKKTITDTPKWVYDSGIKSVAFEDKDGKQHVMPLFWDKDYLAKWSNFVREFATKYDKNPTIHSIGITGGGVGGSTWIAPESDAFVPATGDTTKKVELLESLKKEHGLNQRALVEHWKYVADIFPKRFTTARLNFNINAPVKGRSGEDALDEISDYLVYRYGQRVYLSRQGIKDGKHKFDDYRVLLKFRNDTLTGIQVEDDVDTTDMAKLTKFALDDGISYAELPASLINNKDEAVQTALENLRGHIGYQLVNQKSVLPEKLAIGEPLKASFTFVNIGAAPAMRPERNFDKDVPMSYRLQLELRNSDGKPVLQNVHTPALPTSKWEPNKPVTWEEDLKMVDAEKHQQLPPGEYSVWMSLVDSAAKRKIQFLNATTDGKATSADTVEVGKVTVTTAIADKKPESSVEGASR